MKAVSKSYFKQDPKVRENLEREIRIMKLLKNCEFVVRLNHVQVRTIVHSNGGTIYLYSVQDCTFSFGTSRVHVHM